MRTEEVEGVPIADYLEDRDWFARKDVQGMELDVLKGACEALKRLVGAEIEVEFARMYSGQPLDADVFKFMAREGLHFIDFTSIHRWSKKARSALGRLVVADALFLREHQHIAPLNDRSLADFYIAICIAYQRFDLALELASMQPELKTDALLKLCKRFEGVMALQQRAEMVLQYTFGLVNRSSIVHIVK